MINTLPRPWMNEQRRLGLELCLVLDSQSERETRQLLMKSSGHDQYLSVYNGTTLVNLADAGPYMFTLEQSGDRRLDDLLDHPERNWGWLASVEKGALCECVKHWQERLIVGTRPYQALYRFHDNRVLSRALKHLPTEEYPAFLGAAISVCYWDGTAWQTTKNPAPGMYPVPESPLWLRTPFPQPQASEIRRLNAHRYLLAEHVEVYANLAEVHDPDTWLRKRLALADEWGWTEPEQLEFLLIQSLQAPGFALSPQWGVRGDESSVEHFERVRQLVGFWRGEAPI
ncbi:DUF4123 domain-containing protein [Pseudomonas sp. ZT5P21]